MEPSWLGWARRQFPALARPVVYLDGPAGSQVPLRVADAVRRYLLETNANTHGPFATSVESDACVAAAREAIAELVGAKGGDEIAFGPNMTTLTFAVSRALAREWSAGDEVVVTRLDHDANVTPWVTAAAAAGATLRWVGVREDTALDLDALRACLSARTRLVAVTAASNAAGTLVPIAEVARWVHEAGAELYVDAVHYAPHRRMDVAAWGCDFLACSAYKFFAPHVGVMWSRRERLARLRVDKVRPAPDEPPGRLETGTQSHEGIAGAGEAVEYLADLGREAAGDASLPRRAALDAAYAAITAHERALVWRLIAGLAELPGVRVWGVADPAKRSPTVALTHERVPAHALAAGLAERGVFSWAGNFYALELVRALRLEPHGVLRLGLLHYNDIGDVDRCLGALRDCLRAA